MSELWSFLIIAAGLTIFLVGPGWLEARRSKNWTVTEATVLEVVPIVIPSITEGMGPTYQWKVKYFRAGQGPRSRSSSTLETQRAAFS